MRRGHPVPRPHLWRASPRLKNRSSYCRLNRRGVSQRMRDGFHGNSHLRRSDACLRKSASRRAVTPTFQIPAGILRHCQRVRERGGVPGVRARWTVRARVDPPLLSTELVPDDPPRKLLPIDEKPADIAERFSSRWCTQRSTAGSAHSQCGRPSQRCCVDWRIDIAERAHRDLLIVLIANRHSAQGRLSGHSAKTSSKQWTRGMLGQTR